MPDTPFSVRVYRRLLSLYPAGFRENYADAMEREFRDELADSTSSAGAALWFRLLIDFVLSLPGQIVREITQDTIHALRLWARRPLHTAFAIAALALGIGASTGVFSVVNGLILRELPFRDPDRLAALANSNTPHDSAAQFHAWRTQSTYLADAALTEQNDVNLGGIHDPSRAHVSQTSWNFFSTLGMQPILGRAFLPGEDTPGHDAIAVIGHGLWQQLFAGDHRVLGAVIRINGNPLTIVGVAPPGFDYPGNSVLWKPAVFTPGNNGWETVGRLKPGIGWDAARQAFDVEVAPFVRLPGRHPDPRFHPRLTSLQDSLAGPGRDASLLLLAGVVLILIIACTNVANLLMARTADRATELAVRSALGASRARLVQQMFTECLLLAGAAAIAGLAVAYWATAIAAKVQPPPLAAQSYAVLDWRVLAFTALAAIASGLLFGVLPSLYAGRVHTFATRGSGTTRVSRAVRETLVAAQVMLTIVLLTASVSVGRAFYRLTRLDHGYNVAGVVTVSVSLEGTARQLAHGELAYFEEALARVRRLPGVRSASATTFLPLYATGGMGGPLGIDGRPAPHNTSVIPVMPDYFPTMGGRLLRGREFTAEEVHSNARVAIVNERFAAQFGDPKDAVGRQLTILRAPPKKIIGVAKGMDYEAETPLTDSYQVFLPAHSPGGFFSAFVARVDGRAEDHLAAVRDAVRSVDREVPVFGAKTMEQRLADALVRPRFYSTAALFLAGFAALLAWIGIYGIVSYAVAQRTHEMGVRLALGATPSGLRRILLHQGLLPVALGAIPGIALALLTGRFLEGLLAGAHTPGFTVPALVLAFIALVAAASIWTGTRRITTLDVLTVLRAE